MQLSNYEKAIVYKYSENDYEDINERLRKSKGIDIDDFGTILSLCLEKLPDYKQLCYRAVELNTSEIKRYIDAFKNSKKITEYSFVSCSTSRLIAMQFRHNVLFRIQSKKGKDIQEIAKFGLGNQNEKEILFKFNSQFSILNIESGQNGTLLTLKEI